MNTPGRPWSLGSRGDWARHCTRNAGAELPVPGNDGYSFGTWLVSSDYPRRGDRLAVEGREDVDIVHRSLRRAVGTTFRRRPWYEALLNRSQSTE